MALKWLKAKLSSLGNSSTPRSAPPVGSRRTSVVHVHPETVKQPPSPPPSPPVAVLDLSEGHEDELDEDRLMSVLFNCAAEKGVLSHSQYIKLHSGLFRALRLEWSVEEAKSRAESDWQADSAGATCVPVDRFRASLRMLAARWTSSEPSPGPLGKEAVRFLSKLVKCLTELAPGANGGPLVRQLRAWQDVPLGACVPESVVAALKAKPPPKPAAREERGRWGSGRMRRGRGSFDAEIVARRLARVPYEDGTVQEAEVPGAREEAASGGEGDPESPAAGHGSIILAGPPAPSAPATPLSRSPDCSFRLLSPSASLLLSPSTLSSACTSPRSTVRGSKTVYQAGKAIFHAPPVILQLSLPPALHA